MTTNYVQFSAVGTWVLPDAALSGFSPVASTLFPLSGVALYARDCARLI